VNVAEARSALEGLAAGAATREGTVRLDLGGPVARLVIDNPSARNAMTVRMMVELADAVLRLQEWQGAALVFSAEAGGTPAPRAAFCSGGHLGDVRTALGSPEAGRVMSVAMTAVLDALLALPIVSVAAADGVAMGGGAELLTACDHRVLAAGARVHFVQARLGVAPGWGGARRLIAHVGRPRALRLLTAAEPVSAADALTIGLADAVVPEDAVAGALQWLDPLLGSPAASLRAVKAQVAVAPRTDTAEADAFATVWAGPAHRAALERK
jgi:ethylmalonyl-CoA/methylmalonyl-CoA decarboxylase